MSGLREYKPVTRLFRNRATELVALSVGGTVIKATGEHPFYNAKLGWVQAKDLTPENTLMDRDGNAYRIDAIEYIQTDVPTYNLEVLEYHNYFVSEIGLLVHNACKDLPEHMQNGKNGTKELKADNTYTTGDTHVYQTDSSGRITNASADELHWFESGDRLPRNQYAQSHVGGTDRLATDHGGHLFGNQFGGSSDIDNLIAQQGRGMNGAGGDWFNMEKEWAEILKEGGKVTNVDISVSYIGTSTRPSSITVKCKTTFKGVTEEVIKTFTQ